MTKAIQFFIEGRPEPKGSTSAFQRKNGSIAVTSANRRLGPWARRAELIIKNQGVTELQRIPCRVKLEFVFEKPKSHPKATLPHLTKPDLDKLARACLDAGTGILWKDDSYVTYILAFKRYARPNEQPGVHVAVQWRDWEKGTQK